MSVKTFLQRIAAAIKREPPGLARIDQAPLVTDEPLGQLDRELDADNIAEQPFSDQHFEQRD